MLDRDERLELCDEREVVGFAEVGEQQTGLREDEREADSDDEDVSTADCGFGIMMPGADGMLAQLMRRGDGELTAPDTVKEEELDERINDEREHRWQVTLTGCVC